MVKKAISLMTMSALLINMVGLTGCTRTVNIPMEEVSLEPSATVTRLTFETGGDLTFDENGARYRCKAKMFKGTTSTGTFRGIPLRVVDSVYFRSGTSSAEWQSEAGEFHHEESSKHRIRIRQPITGVYQDEEVFKFDSRHGTIDSLSRTVIGTTKAGDTLSFSIDELSGYRTKKSNAPTIIAVTLGLAAVTAMGFAIYLAANPSWDGSFKE